MSVAGIRPSEVRNRLASIIAAMSSKGLSGLAKSWPRLRAHISSRKEMLSPSWPRNSTSQSRTPASSAPAAFTSQLLCSRKNLVMKPQSTTWTMGQ